MDKSKELNTLQFLNRRKSFAFLYLARLISVTGDNIHLIATMVLVQHLTGSALAMGAVMTANTIPKIIFALIGGVSVDRYNRRLILVLCDALRAVGVIFLVLLSRAGSIQVWQVALFAAFNGAAGAFYSPAIGAVVPTIVEKSELPKANAVGSMTIQIASMVGAALGGIVVGTLGIWVGYIFDSISYLLSALIILPLAIPIIEQQRSKVLQPGISGVWSDLKDGLRYIFFHKSLLAIVILWTATVFVALPVAQLLPSFTAKTLFLTSEWVGYLWSGMTVGMFLGAMFVNSRFRLNNPVFGILLSTLLYGMGALILGLNRNFFIALFCMALLGFSLNHGGILSSIIYQKVVPAEMLGRFFANTSLLTLALQPIVMWLAGVAADASSAKNVFVWLGCLLLAFCLAWSMKYDAISKSVLSVDATVSPNTNS